MQMKPRIFGLMIMPQRCASRARGVEEFSARRAVDFWQSPAVALRCAPVHLRKLFLFLCISAVAHAEGGALAAIKLIPAEAAKRLVAIEAREGTPAPERWYLLVNDPGEQRGVREFVVADGRFVTSRTLSQFAETLKPADIIGGDAVKVDSTHVAKLAAAFAEANGAKVGSLNYDLARDAASNVPLWKVTVLDASGDQLGILAVNAAKGTVLSADGFEKSPSPASLAPPAAIASADKAAAKKTKATPTPKPGLLKRFFGKNEKPANP
jgi:hypothetical protein